MTFRKSLLFMGIPVFVAFLSSCEGLGKKDGGEGSAFGVFLKTNYTPLATWLDERFEVDYKHMTPQLIFDQVPLNDVVYETSNLPTSGAAFNYSSRDISRRELLRQIATHWNLKMSLSNDSSGIPVAIRVEG